MMSIRSLIPVKIMYKAQTIQLIMSWQKQNTMMHKETENNEGVREITENNNCNNVLSEM